MNKPEVVLYFMGLIWGMGIGWGITMFFVLNLHMSFLPWPAPYQKTIVSTSTGATIQIHLVDHD